MKSKRVVVYIAASLMLAGSFHAFAQDQIILRPMGGAALSYIRTGPTDAKFSPLVLPHIGLTALIPIEGHFSLKTGLLYEQKGWRTNSAFSDTDNVRTEFLSSIKLHTLNLPLELCYSGSAGKSLQYSLSSGMSYCFFVKAEENMDVSTYYKDRLLQTTSSSWNPRIVLMPDGSRLKNSFDAADYCLFNPEFRVDATITLKTRYVVETFWEYSLNEISASPGNTTSPHLGYYGISLGISLR